MSFWVEPRATYRYLPSAGLGQETLAVAYEISYPIRSRPGPTAARPLAAVSDGPARAPGEWVGRRREASRRGGGACAWFLGAACQLWTCVAGAQESPPYEAEVVVRGQRSLLPSSSRAATSASTVLEGEELHAAGATSAEVLSQVPGVQVARQGGQAELSTASIRGSGSNQVPVYIAGIRINDDVTGTANLSTVPLWMMERAEVFRGNAPEEADRLGIGGAIFFTPRVPKKTSVGAGATVGSYGQREGWVAGEVAAPGAAALVALRRAQAQNDYPFRDDHGQRFDLNETLERRENADYTDHEAWAIGRYRLGRGAHVTSVMQGLHREQGVTGVAGQPARQARGETRRILLGVATRLPCRSDSEACVLSLNSSLIVAQLRLEDPNLELPAARSPVLQNNGERFTQSGRVKVRLNDRVRLSAKVMASFENLRLNRMEKFSPRAGRNSMRASLNTEFDLTRKFSTHLLVAGECHTTDGMGERYGQPVVQKSGACGVLEPVGRVGVLYRALPEVEFLGNAGRYLRLPTLGELYGTSSLVNGNVELVPETGWSADLGTRLSFENKGKTEARFALDGFAFARWVDQLIRYRRSSLKTVSPFNVANARYLGVELAAALELFSFLKAKTAITVLDPRETTKNPSLDPTKNDVLPLTSRLVVNQSLTVHSKKGWPALRLATTALTLRYQHRSSRFADSAGQTVLPAQDFLDLEGSAKFFEERLSVRFSVRNLLNQMTSDLLGLPLPGRTYFGSLELWF